MFCIQAILCYQLLYILCSKSKEKSSADVPVIIHSINFHLQWDFGSNKFMHGYGSFSVSKAAIQNPGWKAGVQSHSYESPFCHTQEMVPSTWSRARSVLHSVCLRKLLRRMCSLDAHNSWGELLQNMPVAQVFALSPLLTITSLPDHRTRLC